MEHYGVISRILLSQLYWDIIVCQKKKKPKLHISVYNLMSLGICVTVSTINVINIFITSRSFSVSFYYCVLVCFLFCFLVRRKFNMKKKRKFNMRFTLLTYFYVDSTSYSKRLIQSNLWKQTIEWWLERGEGGHGELLFNGYKITVIQDEYALEICCITQSYT